MAEVIDTAKFNEITTGRDGFVVIDFFATWCGPCKMLAPVIDELSEELKNIPVVKVDIDKSEDLALKYNVRSVPTVIVFKDGVEKDRIVGVCDKEEIKSLLE